MDGSAAQVPKYGDLSQRGQDTGKCVSDKLMMMITAKESATDKELAYSLIEAHVVVTVMATSFRYHTPCLCTPYRANRSRASCRSVHFAHHLRAFCARFVSRGSISSCASRLAQFVSPASFCAHFAQLRAPFRSPRFAHHIVLASFCLCVRTLVHAVCVIHLLLHASFCTHILFSALWSAHFVSLSCGRTHACIRLS